MTTARLDKAFEVFAIVFLLSLLCALILACEGCSHNPAQIVLGEQTRLGFGEYGAFSSTEGLVVIDVPRENTIFILEIDGDKGVTYDAKTGTVKGVKKITRAVGPQITGYLVDLAKASPEAAAEYFRTLPNVYKVSTTLSELVGKTEGEAGDAAMAASETAENARESPGAAKEAEASKE